MPHHKTATPAGLAAAALLGLLAACQLGAYSRTAKVKLVCGRQ